MDYLYIQLNILEPPTHNKIGYNENDATTPLHTTQHSGTSHIQQNWLQQKQCYNTSTYNTTFWKLPHTTKLATTKMMLQHLDVPTPAQPMKASQRQIKHLTTWQTNNDIQHNILEPPTYNRIGYNDNNATTPLHTVQHCWNLPHATKLAAAK